MGADGVSVKWGIVLTRSRVNWDVGEPIQWVGGRGHVERWGVGVGEGVVNICFIHTKSHLLFRGIELAIDNLFRELPVVLVKNFFLDEGQFLRSVFHFRFSLAHG